MRALFIPDNSRAAAVKGLRRTGSTAGQSPDESRRDPESRRGQEEGGELDSHEEVKLICGPSSTGSGRDQEEGGGAGPSS